MGRLLQTFGALMSARLSTFGSPGIERLLQLFHYQTEFNFDKLSERRALDDLKNKDHFCLLSFLVLKTK